MTPPERERQLEQWLSSQPRPTASEPTSACVDAETAAAWYDGSLPDEMLVPVQTHVADCSRCQALMLAMLEVSADPLPVDATSSPVAWWRSWLAWGAPLTAAAVAVLALAVWLRMPAPAQPSAGTVFEQARQESNPAEPDARGSLSSTALPAPAPAVAPQSVVPEAPAEAPKLRESLQAASPDTTPASPGAPPARSEVATPAQAAAADSANRAAALDAAQKASPAPPPPPPAAPTPPAARVAAAPSASAAAPVGAAGFVSSPGSTFIVAAGFERWRVTGARIEYSPDAGQTWATTAGAGPVTLVAGAAPAPKTCWLVGRAGIVLLTVDGSTWRRLPFGESTDLTAIVAGSAKSATVIAADGRRFETADGGQSWSPR